MKFGKMKRIIRTFGLPIIFTIGGAYLTLKMTGTPTEMYRTIEVIDPNQRTEADYFNKEVYRMVKEINVDGKSGVRYWEDYVKDRNAAEQLTRKRVQEMIKAGRATEKEVVQELEKIDNYMVQDSLTMARGEANFTVNSEDSKRIEEEAKKKR